MKSKFVFLLISVIVLAFGTVMVGFVSKTKLAVEGAWQVAEVITVKPDGTSSSTFPKESVIIFSKNYYSFCWTSHYANSRSWQMADSSKLNRFNQSIINTGTFELKDSILTTKAMFAMNPMFVDGLAKFKCYYSGDTLVLRGLSVYSSDKIAHPAYANGSYFVTKLLRVGNK